MDELIGNIMATIYHELLFVIVSYNLVCHSQIPHVRKCPRTCIPKINQMSVNIPAPWSIRWMVAKSCTSS